MEFRELSSAGSEHLPYKQRVTGSNPVVPTNKDKGCRLLQFVTLFDLHNIRTQTPLKSILVISISIVLFS